jgi:hypothetical protein
MEAIVLSASRTALTAIAIRFSKAATRKQLLTGTLGLHFDNGMLTVEIAGASDSLPAAGHWPGRLRVSSSVIIYLAKGEPPGDPVQLSYEDGRLHVRDGVVHIKFKAQWEDISPPALDIPLDAGDADYLRLAAAGHAPAQLVAMGLDKKVADCELRFQQAVNAAVSIFAKYNIPHSILESAIRDAIVRPRDPSKT